MIIDFLQGFYVFTNSKVRKNYRTHCTYIDNNYTNGGIEFETQLTGKKENIGRQLKLVSQENR